MTTLMHQKVDIQGALPLPAAVPVRQVLPWATFGGLLMGLAIYFIGIEEGAFSIGTGAYAHEYFHDARHLLGFPCH